MSTQVGRDVTNLVPAALGAVKRDEASAVGVSFRDAANESVPAVDLFLRSVFVNSGSVNTVYAYAVALLRWWRFLAAPEVAIPWERATRTEFDDFILWMRVATPKRGGDWRHGAGSHGKVGEGFAGRTINHNIATLASFYHFHDENGGPISPIPSQGRVHAHHNPMDPFARASRGPGRQRVADEAPKSLSDEQVARLLKAISEDRDRAIVEFLLSSGARASELVNLTGECVDTGQHRILVTRKGGNVQWIPASPESFLYLRKYLKTRELRAGEPVWLTLRSPHRKLSYHGMRAVLLRLESELGMRHRLHHFRHTAAYNMMSDPELSPRDVQEILGHAWLTTTQIYTRSTEEEVLRRAAEYFQRKKFRPRPAPIELATGYNQGSLANIFGGPNGR